MLKHSNLKLVIVAVIILLLNCTGKAQESIDHKFTITIIDTGIDLNNGELNKYLWTNPGETGLDKLGSDTILADPHRFYVNGITKLKPAEVICPPALRPAAIILIGMLGAEGKSILRNVYSISRGYENIVKRLNSLGAKIKILKE